MKNYLLFFCFLFVVFNAKAQINLVPNPSFEEHTNCPNSSNRVLYLNDWDLDYNTADFFHECSTTSYSIPNNYAGNQCASTGNAYTGFYPYTFVLQADRREYIGGKLTDSLMIGVKYFVSFKVSLAEISPCSVNNIGVKFLTKNLINSNTYTPYIILPPAHVNNITQVNNPTIITDSIGWTTVRGSFVADSSYINFLIGNFYSIPNIDTLVQSGWSTCQSYYFLDDVCISTDSLFCENVKAQLISIIPDSTAITQNSCINYNLQTSINYSAYEWHFQGGFPASSAQMNPTTICYQNTGNFDVTFIGHKNGGCTDTLNLSNLITVDTLTPVYNLGSKPNGPQFIFSDPLIYISNNNHSFTYKIYDIGGRVLQNGQVNASNQTINCSFLKTGTYFFTSNNEAIQPFKFMVHSNSN